MDEDLIELLSYPFGEVHSEEKLLEAFESSRRASSVTAVAERTVTARTIHDHSIFRKDIELLLRPHVSSATLIHSKLFTDIAPLDVRRITGPLTEKFREQLELLKKAYQTNVETATYEVLAREAERLKRRYFEEEATPRQLSFIRLKRYYEKIRSFNSRARKCWHEIQKILDPMSVLAETKEALQTIERDHLSHINQLLRQTDSFLDALGSYLHIQQENRDAVTGNHRITLEYNPDIIYSLPAFFGDPVPEEDEEISSPLFNVGLEGEEFDEPPRSSIARNIIIETKEQRLNRASMISAVILGSRDWNRTPYNSLDLPVTYYEVSLNNFKKACQVALIPDTPLLPMSPTAAMSKIGEGKHHLENYVTMLHELLEENAREIIETDFPGLEKPLVFLYHCGPPTMMSILLAELNNRRLGDIQYLDETGSLVQKIPEDFIKKEVIEWWNEKIGHLDVDEIDSYMTYSRAIEMVKKEYRMLYEEGTHLRQEEQPGASYLDLEKWMRQNRYRVFGYRKMEIFRRFLRNTILD